MQMKLLLAVLLLIMAHFLLLFLSVWVVVVFHSEVHTAVFVLFPAGVMERMMSIV